MQGSIISRVRITVLFCVLHYENEEGGEKESSMDQKGKSLLLASALSPGLTHGSEDMGLAGTKLQDNRGPRGARDKTCF